MWDWALPTSRRTDVAATDERTPTMNANGLVYGSIQSSDIIVVLDPRENAVVPASPVEIRIVFDGELEPAFSGIEVTDVAGRRVDKRDASVDGKNRRLLRVGLGAMRPGVYRVSWEEMQRKRGD